MSGAVERHLEVTRTARYWILGEERDHPSDVWFVLHGYRQLAGRFIRRFDVLADGDRWIVASEALSRFYVGKEEGRHGPGSLVGATWMTREDREAEIRDYVAYLDRLAESLFPEGDPPRVTVLGFSQGAATAARWAVYGAVKPARLVLWGDFLPPDLDMARAAAALSGVDLVSVRGSDDATLDERLVREEAERLRSVGLERRLVTFSGGHVLDAETLAALV